MGSCISTPSSSTRQSTKYVGGQYVLGGGNNSASTPSQSRGQTQGPLAPARPQSKDVQKPAPTSPKSSPTTALLSPSTAPSANDEARRRAIAQAAEARQKANTNRGSNASNPKRDQLPRPTPTKDDENLVWE
ncbi:hypothetical protein BD410DRAFT_222524 [Rickenella mellea]|uniref:Uncharacterized protein n=1 Tax=Rickenella mellea TaxID=50990 RepID=A0A4Y7QM76_9AGAM|nr:hypothetical protein BD410DRAFT_222524 [Rickenella mellea]